MKLIKSENQIEDRFFFEAPMGVGPQRLYRLYVDKRNKKLHQFIWDPETNEWSDTESVIRAIISGNSDFSETTYEEAKEEFPKISREMPEGE